MNSFGTKFRITIFGESHGANIGISIDGVPPGISINTEDFLNDLNRRKPGAFATSKRVENDTPNFISGVYKNHSTGAIITALFDNTNIQSEDYNEFRNHPRPGHADFAACKKFNNYNDLRGSGSFSGRLTVTLVTAGVIAKKLIKPIEIKAELIEAGGSKDIDSALINAEKTATL